MLQGPFWSIFVLGLDTLARYRDEVVRDAGRGSEIMQDYWLQQLLFTFDQEKGTS